MARILLVDDEPSILNVLSTLLKQEGHDAVPVRGGEKAQELILHLIIATLSVTLLIWVFLGWREALVVLVAVPVTLALTLASSYLFGYTLNRVTLFALIFAIGILVDDAIVVVENIQRRDLTAMEEAESFWHLKDKFGMTQDEIAERVGKDRTTVSNAMRLLKLPAEIRAQVEDGLLSAGHARPLLPLPEPLRGSSPPPTLPGQLKIRPRSKGLKRNSISPLMAASPT